MTTGTILAWNHETWENVIGVDLDSVLVLMVNVPVGMLNAAEALAFRSGDQVVVGSHWRTGQTCIVGQVWSPA
jgi:hypothetical protein